MIRSDVTTSRLLVQYQTNHVPITALDHPGLRVDGGTSLAIMGPSGCGKSTLMGLLAGLATPTQGSVTIGETNISSLTEADRVAFRRSELGMVYQADNLLPHLTVEENVALPLAIRDDAPSATPQAVLDRLGLEALSRRFPDQLSGGQRQRVAVARAVVGNPCLILADEPTGALDEHNARAVMELLTTSQRAIGATLIVVTHASEIAAHLDRVELLRRPTFDQEVAPGC